MEKKKGVKKQKNVTFIGVRPINEYAKGIATQFTHKKEKEMIIHYLKYFLLERKILKE